MADKYTDYSEDDLVSAAAADMVEKRDHNWLCQICFTEHDFSVNVGQPEKRKCDHCHRANTTCYKVIKK